MKNIGLRIGNYFAKVKHVSMDFKVFEDYFKTSYVYINNRKVNEKFAEVTINALKKTLEGNPDQLPIIWIHDYHLMLAANTIRQVSIYFHIASCIFSI